MTPDSRLANRFCHGLLGHVCAVLYEMATGRRPFDGASAASVIGGILKDTPPAISTRQPLAPPALDHVVEMSSSPSLSILAKSLLIARSFAGIALPLLERLSYHSGIDVSGVHSQCCRSCLPDIGAHERECP
jgi:hypothetical protein